MRRIKEVCIIVAISLMLLLFFEGGVRLSGIEKDYMQLLTGRSLVMKDSLLGHRNQPGAVVRKQGPEFSATYAIGSQGLRVAPTDRQATAATPPDSFRIVLIGDSFTFGIGTNYEATWAHVLERALQERGWAVEVFNAGVPGYDTRTEALYVDQLLPRLHPDLVVLTFLPNDLFTNRPIGDTTTVRTVVGRDEKTPALHVVSWLRRLVAQHDWLYTQFYRHSARGPFFERAPHEMVEAQFATTGRLIERIHTVCQEQNVPLVVLSLPQQFQVLVTAHGYTFEGINIRRIDEWLGDQAQRGGYRWMSALDTLATAYTQAGQDMYYRIDGHLTPEGNNTVGVFLANWLNDAGYTDNMNAGRSLPSEH